MFIIRESLVLTPQLVTKETAAKTCFSLLLLMCFEYRKQTAIPLHCIAPAVLPNIVEHAHCGSVYARVHSPYITILSLMSIYGGNDAIAAVAFQLVIRAITFLLSISYLFNLILHVLASLSSEALETMRFRFER